MPQLDAITPNPKQPKKLFKPTAKRLPSLSPDEVVRRRRLTWGIVAGVTAVILIIWFSTLDSRLGNIGGDNSAWDTLKQKAADLVGVFRRGGDEKVKNIDVNAPTEADIEYLREQVFPNSGAVTGDDVDAPTSTNANVPGGAGSASGGNASANSNGNTNAR